MRRNQWQFLFLLLAATPMGMCNAQDRPIQSNPDEAGARVVTHKENNASGQALGMTICVNGQWEQDCAHNPIPGNPVGLYVEISTTREHLPVWAANPLCNVLAGADADCRVEEVDLNNWGSDVAARSGPLSHPGDHLKMGIDVVTGGAAPSTCAFCEINAPSSGNWHYDVLLHRAIDATLGVNAPFVSEMHITQVVNAGPCLLRLNTGENYEVLRGSTGTLDRGDSAEDVLIGSGADSIGLVNGLLQIRTTCTRAHEAGALFATYTARRGVDLSNAAYQASSLNLGSLFWQARHGTHPGVHVAINDAANQEQIVESYTSVSGGGMQHSFHDLGGGFLFTGNVAASAIAAETVSTHRGTPKSSTESCHRGEMWSDQHYVYVCAAENEIRRTALERF